MEEISSSYKQSGNLHHAYFLVGDKINVLKELISFLEGPFGFETSGNPDFWIGQFDNLTIDDAREISQNSERKDFSGNKKVFIIQTDFISQEAQNSLLKVFEEPTEGTHFFIVSPQDSLLPTLRSRMQVIHSVSEFKQNGESVLKMNIKERLARVKEITDAISDEESTKQDAISLLNSIEKDLYDSGVEKNHSFLKLCEETRASLYDRGAPVKMILENLLLSI